MSDPTTTPTAAYLLECADDAERAAQGSAYGLSVAAALRAGAAAMDERDRLASERDAVDGYIAELNAALAQDNAELDRLRADRAALTAALAKMIALAHKLSDGQSMMGTTAAAETVLAEHGADRPAAVDDTLPKLSEMKGAFRERDDEAG